MCTIDGVLLQFYAVLLLKLLFTPICRKIYFATNYATIYTTIYALSCGENLSPKVPLWRKMINIRYG